MQYDVNEATKPKVMAIQKPYNLTDYSFQRHTSPQRSSTELHTHNPFNIQITSWHTINQYQLKIFYLSAATSRVLARASQNQHSPTSAPNLKTQSIKP